MAYPARETVVAHPTWTYGLMWVGFPVLGAGAGWLLALILDWAASRSWLPLPEVLRVVAKAPDLPVVAGAAALGALAGLVLAAMGAEESLAVAVSDDAVLVVRGDSLGRAGGGAPARGRGAASRFARGSVGAAFLDGRQLVLLGPDGAELTREPSDLNAGRLAEAFQAHGYPWRNDGDPHASEFRRWVPGIPDLPHGADALLKARSRALDKGDRRDAKELREELSRLGVVVREENKRQYYRVVSY